MYRDISMHAKSRKLGRYMVLDHLILKVRKWSYTSHVVCVRQSAALIACYKQAKKRSDYLRPFAFDVPLIYARVHTTSSSFPSVDLMILEISSGRIQ